MNNNPIAVFDSGMGGVSVLRQLVRIMPNENYIFFGDSKNAPYGTKNVDDIRKLSEDAFLMLKALGAKALLIACNTATSASAEYLRKKYPDFPIIGIEPAIKPAALSGTNRRILVMATPATVAGEKLHLLADRFTDISSITCLPCPGLMEFIERGDLDGDDLQSYLNVLLAPYKGKTDCVVTGCTHYPFVQKHIVEALGGNVDVFDGGDGAAREMHRRLESADMLCDRQSAGTIQYLSSCQSAENEELFNRLLNL